MFFLLRSAFWLSLLVMLIPVDDEIAAARAPSANAVAPFDAIYAAQETISDVGGFCERSPTACMIGAEVLDLLALKARSGIKMAFDYLDGEAAGTLSPAEAGTLNASDLDPVWRGPAEAI